MTAAFHLLMCSAPPLSLIQDQAKASLIRRQRIAVLIRIPATSVLTHHIKAALTSDLHFSLPNGT